MQHVVDRLALQAMQWVGYRHLRLPTPTGRVSALVYEGGGQLPPLTILHGWASAGVHQAFIAQRLKHLVRRLTLPDIPGHGFSEGPEDMAPLNIERGLHAALNDLHPEPTVLLGSSFGGLAAMRYAVKHPERVAGLVLVSPFGAPMPAGDLAYFIEMLRARSLRDTLSFLHRVGHRPQLRNWVFAPQMHQILRRPSLQRLLDHEDAVPLLTRADLERVRVPVTVVWGRKEALFPESHLDFWRELPDVRVVRPAYSGHSPSIQEPARFEQIVVDHLEHVAMVGV